MNHDLFLSRYLQQKSLFNRNYYQKYMNIVFIFRKFKYKMERPSAQLLLFYFPYSVIRLVVLFYSVFNFFDIKPYFVFNILNIYI